MSDYDTTTMHSSARRRRSSSFGPMRARSSGSNVPYWRPYSRRRSMLRPSSQRGETVERYRRFFEMISRSPSDELAIVRELNVPLIKSTTVVLPFDLDMAVADNCLSLSGMGYQLGIGGCCPVCSSSGEPRLNRIDRSTLILAYVQQVNHLYQYRTFLASIQAASDRISDDASETENILACISQQPEFFFAYYVLREAGMRDIRVLFYRDVDEGGYVMYIPFTGNAVHLHYRLIDCLKSACRGYRLMAHVWHSTFVLVVRRDRERQTDVDSVPQISIEDIYCKMCDLNFDGELLLEYRKLYAAFDDFPPPR
ncbi:UL31 [anatid alphaherpesvirus 1]|uniref:UL31 n=6 Tax=anatid alphaherpesvirus 1 TaxID=104388 RepID=A4GRK2_9ALPH|nr:UL31 [Anatid alphaherpesvirus 1]YP_010795344.1 UL31 [Anatid alphaherpesvirus 1]AHD45950.1 UL31 [BAC cloning vector pDEV-vac]QWQ49769.1 UL31 [BAC cloning vector pDEV-CHa]ABO26218.1 UL31-like [Anatid alphaherpesvirus 1]ACT83542.1 UL31 [Anatid alphaherpesvirus 1]AEN80094.1 UL31 [Anatid alphaherpesvirus 1]